MQNWPLSRKLFTAVALIAALGMMALFITLMSGQFRLLSEHQELHANAILGKYQQALTATLTQSQAPERQNLLIHMMAEDDVRGVTLYDTDNQLLTHQGLPDSQASDQFATFLLPIRDYSRNLLEEKSGPAETKPLGWLEIRLDKNKIRLAQYQLLFPYIALAVALLAAVVAALYLTIRQFTAPIGDIRQQIRQLEPETQHWQLQLPLTGELASLQEDLNHFFVRLTEFLEELEKNIKTTEGDLRETLDTLEVQNIELTLARQEALKASQIKSQFLANMSHEIRTPLNGIIGFTNLLLKSPINERQRDFLVTIQKSSETLLAIINDILDFSKIEAGKLSLDPQPFNLQQVIEDTITMLSPMANEKGLEQSYLLYDDVPRSLLGDPLRIRQVLTNLLNNAIKFTPKGEVVIRAMVEEEQDDDILIRISVSDTGIGLSQQDQETLFQPFNQLDNSLARESGGSGLGLVISQHLVELMGGHMGVDSKPGEGACFWFTLKLKQRSGHYLPASTPGECPSVYLFASHTRTSTLMLKQFCEHAGASVTLATPESGFPKPRHETLLLASLPATDYQDVHLQECLQTHSWEKILLLGFPESGYQNHFRQFGDAIFLHKPVTESALLPLLGASTQTDPQSSRGETTSQDETHKTIVMAVDDNPSNLKLLKILLEDLGVECIACQSGHEAIEVFPQQKIDLVFMDIQMPGMDGIETADRLRQLQRHGSCPPIIALTAHALADEKQKLLKAGFNNYLTKPISEHTLEHILFQWLPPLQNRQRKPGITQLLHPGTPSTPPAADVLFDRALGLQRAANKVDLAADMLAMLLDELDAATSKLDQARHAFQQTEPAGEEWESLLALVHKLNGASRYSGSKRLETTLSNLEKHLKNQDAPETIALCLDKLIQVIQQLRDWIDQQEEPIYKPDPLNA